MRDSDTYLAILEEGEEKGRKKQAQENILDLGEQRFGPPNKAVLDQLQSTTDLAHLNRIYFRLLDATSWDDLLATP